LYEDLLAVPREFISPKSAGRRLAARLRSWRCMSRTKVAAERLYLRTLCSRCQSLSNALAALGCGPAATGFAIVLPQRAETATRHLALYQMAAVACRCRSCSVRTPCIRLRDSGAWPAICDGNSAEILARVARAVPDLAH